MSAKNTLLDFYKRIHITPDCWLWTGRVDKCGYGILDGFKHMPGFEHTNGYVLAHRLSYSICVTSLIPSMDIDHLCRIKSCINPDHLEPVTILENTRRGRSGEYYKRIVLARPTCKNGHAWADGNYRTYTSSNGNPIRKCIPCNQASQKRYYQRLRGLIKGES